MSMVIEGKAPGVVCYRLSCESRRCLSLAIYEIAIKESPPSIDDDWWGHIAFENGPGAARAFQMGWTHVAGGFGWYCPRCSKPTPAAEK